MNRRRLAQTLGAPLIGAIAMAAGWSARPLAHDHHANHVSCEAFSSDDIPSPPDPGKDLASRR